MESTATLQEVADLTSRGMGVDPDADALVYRWPKVERRIPGWLWQGRMQGAKSRVQLPRSDLWNGRLLIGGTPAVRGERSLDGVLGDIALQNGYVFATCDKATPSLVLRAPNRSMAEWLSVYKALTKQARELVTEVYGEKSRYTYIAGLSNGGYVTRRMLEEYPQLFDGGVEWEGVFWHPTSRHLLTTLPEWVMAYPVFRNWRGDYTLAERRQAHERLLSTGLTAASEPFWNDYFMVYWVVSLWLYGRNLDRQWQPFAVQWSNDWLRDPSFIGKYPWAERMEETASEIDKIANTGCIGKPLLSVAGNWDCLIPFQNHAQAYAELVASQGQADWHRLYEIEAGNHVDAMLRGKRQGQQPVQPFFEAALHHLEAWVEEGVLPPRAGKYTRIEEFSGMKLYSKF